MVGTAKSEKILNYLPEGNPSEFGSVKNYYDYPIYKSDFRKRTPKRSN